jgi:hypothetical protein
VDLINKKVEYDQQNQFLSAAIALYVKSFFRAIESDNPNEFVNFELK